MELFNKLNSSYKYVCKNAEYVKINYTKIEEMVAKIDSSFLKFWLLDNPFGLLDMDIESIINFLLIYHTIGDYCFWGDPKWKVITSDGVLDGSYAIMYLVIKRFKQNDNFAMSYLEFAELLKGEGEIPLIRNRYDNLVLMNEFLQKEGKSFYELVKDMNSDTELLDYLVKNLSYFEDETIYKGERVYFYKRAQLLTSDILHVKKIKGIPNIDYSHLVGCADYKIPQVMRCYGMIEFSSSLEAKVDQKIELEENSPEEIEIRAATLAVIDYIYEKTDRKFVKMDINDFIWLLGQDKEKMIKPYHRTLTSHY